MKLARALSVVAADEVLRLAQGQIGLDELRALLSRHFESYRAKHRERAALNGPRLEEELEAHEQFVGRHEKGQLADRWNDTQFEIYVSDKQVPVTKGSTEYEQLRSDHAEQSIEYRRYIVDHDRALKVGSGIPPSPPANIAGRTAPKRGEGSTLSALGEEFVKLQTKSGRWDASTSKERVRHLEYLFEIIPPATLAIELTPEDARHVRDVLMDTPVNRNKMEATRGLPLVEQTKVEGTKKLDLRTVKKHLQTYRSMFSWASESGYVTEDPFVKVTTPRGSAKDVDEGRKPFWGLALQAMLSDLVSNRSGLVTQPHYKWATLTALYSGGRLNEVCQLELTDVLEREGVPCISINDEGDEGKSVKTNASRRIVPLHSVLIEKGFLGYVNEMREAGAPRLFPKVSWSEKSKYGRAVGRWFNERYLPALGFKDDSHSFHSFRHTMITTLTRAGVDEPLVQSIVGHQRAGVTQSYAKAGYSMEQRRAALEKFVPEEVPDYDPAV